LDRIIFAFRSFFAILFGNRLPEDIAAAYGYVLKSSIPPPPPPAPVVKPSDGALQMLAILQRDSRLVDFLMEDITGYSDDQVGAAVRSLHDGARQALARYLEFAPVIDGVEGTYARLDSALAKDVSSVKLLGNVPANGKAPGGVLRHRGWRVTKVDLPPLTPNQNPAIVAPAEIEIE
jgi:hypothetical protein